MNGDLAVYGRGPEPELVSARLALDKAAELTEEGLTLGPYLRDFCERWRANERELNEHRIHGLGLEWMTPELRNAVRMVEGVRFWDRDVPEPSPPVGALEP